MAKTGKKKQKAFIKQAIATSKKRNRKAGRGNDISQELLDAAFELYCNKMAVKEIGRKLSISACSLYKYKKRDGWEDRKAKRLKAAANRSDNEYAAVKSRHIGVAKALQAKGLQSLKVYSEEKILLTPTETRLFLVDGVKLERELMGEGISNTDIKIAVIFPAELSGI